MLLLHLLVFYEQLLQMCEDFVADSYIGVSFIHGLLFVLLLFGLSSVFLQVLGYARSLRSPLYNC